MIDFPTNIDLVKELLKQYIADSEIDQAIKKLKGVITVRSDRYDELLALQRRHRIIFRDRLQELHTDEQLRVLEARLRRDLLEFINSIEEGDLLSSPEPVKGKNGHLLYRIPGKMQVKKEVRCMIRIAKDEAIAKERIEIDEHVEEERIRVSETMMVELIDPAADQPFAIRSINEAEQLVKNDDYTEWVFYVPPQLEGIFPLILKVSVVEYVKGQPKKRENTFVQEIEITAAAVPEEIPAAFRSAGYVYSFATPTIPDLTFKYLEAFLFAIALGDRSSHVKKLSSREREEISSILSRPEKPVEERIAKERSKPVERKQSTTFTGRYDYFRDWRDGKEYRTLVINGLRWMVDNLNYDIREGCWFLQ